MGISFKEVCREDIALILDWRTNPIISQNLIVEIEHNIENQIKWFNNCQKNLDFEHWLILFNNNPIGYLSLNNLYNLEKPFSFGFFIGNQDYLNFGSIILFYLYNIIFFQTEIKKINIEVMKFNTRAIEMHLQAGYQFQEHHNRIIEKKSKPCVLIAMCLKKEDWLKQIKFHKFKTHFPKSTKKN